MEYKTSWHRELYFIRWLGNILWGEGIGHPCHLILEYSLLIFFETYFRNNHWENSWLRNSIYTFKSQGTLECRFLFPEVEWQE